MDAAFAVLGGATIFVVLVLIAYYVFFSIGTYYVLKQLGFAHPWLAWIPIRNSIALGLSIADEDGKNKVFGYSIPNLALALYSVIAIAVSYFPFIGTILSLAVSIVK